MEKISIGKRNKGRFIKGYHHSPETIEKIRKSHIGIGHTEESKRKISESKKGTKAWNKGLKAKDHPGLMKALDAAHKAMIGNIPWNKGIHKSLNDNFSKGNQLGKLRKGIKMPQSVIEAQTGSKNVQWKGDDVGYSGLHKWVYRQLGKAKKCSNCGTEKNIQWANLSHCYMRSKYDWIELCVKCHKKHDKKV